MRTSFRRSGDQGFHALRVSDLRVYGICAWFQLDNTPPFCGSPIQTPVERRGGKNLAMIFIPL